MKGLLLACLCLAALTAAAPASKRQGTVTPEDLARFRLFAQWSAAAGCNDEKSPGQPVTCNLSQCSLFESHNATVASSFIGTVLDTRGFVGIDPADQVIVVSFRGTTSVRNWIADSIFVQVPCDLTPGCLAHTGFYASWGEIKPAVLAAVGAAKSANPSYKIILTGHSLGGAVATLAAAYIREAGYAADLYTYGSPRVGNTAFARFVTEQAGGEYRLTHADDPVPRLPPIFVNYRHVSPEYWFEDKNGDGAIALDEITVCPGYSNTDCNGGTKGLDTDAHGWYFGELYGCSPDTPPFRRAAGEMSDAELETKVNEWVEMDIQVAANLHAEGQL
ncbi:hypothetical protein VTK56DRAFT_662 [Thermocarpiscus australiensis]